MSYETARAELRDAELALMQQREAVAALRRALPAGPATTDYAFTGATGSLTLTDLLADDRPLVLYHFMFGGLQTEPCPMCAMWADGWNAVAHHIAENVNFALVSDAPIEDTLALADTRGWTDLQWLSAHGTSFKAEIGGADDAGHQSPFLSTWELGGDGPRLAYSGGAHIAGDHWRGIDLLSPVWHILDLTRAGRGEWMPSV